FTCPVCGHRHFIKETDIMDVWFDSGSTHAAVLDQRDYLQFPADLYLEGGDQYRGWFQSSMLTSIAMKGAAPYKQIVTHGWTVDGEGKAMHKSLGNTMAPEEIIKDYGADLLRLWVASADYTQDMRISKDIMKQLSQAYLKIRNTARYMISNLFDFHPDTDRLPLGEMKELDRFALHTFNDLCKTVRDAYDRYEFHAAYRAIYNFCVVDQSNFYLDIIKDRLYCDGPASPERRSAQTALYTILDGMTRMLAPMLAFTSDEIWAEMPHGKEDNRESVLLNDLPAYDPAACMDAAQVDKWQRLVAFRDAANKALENARTNGVLKKNQDAELLVYTQDLETFALLSGTDLGTLCIVSKVTVVSGTGAGDSFEESPVTIAVTLSQAPKCVRCWNHNEHIGQDPAHPELCPRCAEVVKAL
ncbi:MAG: class I tRNA ligase family protein, partial [Pseudoflavonifractor sp.]